MSAKKKEQTVDFFKMKYAVKFRALMEAENISAYRLAQLMGVGKIRISRIVNAVNPPSLQDMDTLKKVFPGLELNDFFSDGVRTKKVVIENVNALNPSGNGAEIPMVGQKAAGGYAKGFSQDNYLEKLPVLQLPGIRKGMAFEISGDSMEPHIHEGSIVVCTRVADRNTILNNKLYIVVTREEGVVLKQVQNQLKEKGILRLLSFNSKYLPYNVKEDELIQVWKVDKIISVSEPDFL